MAPAVITFVWSMLAGACLAVGVIHLGASVRARRVEGLAFSGVAFSVMFLAVFELLLMKSQTPAEFGAVQQWMHVAIFTAVVSLVVFVRAYFRAGHLWLAYAVCALRLAALALNFILTPNLEFSTITALAPLTLFGETVSVPVGVASPWVLVGEAGAFLLIVFVADATITAWRRGSEPERRRTLLMGGSLLLALMLAGINTALLRSGMVQSIYLSALPFSLVLMAVGFETSASLAGSARLSGRLVEVQSELRQSQGRLDLAAGVAGIGIWEWDVARDEFWVTARARELFGVAPGERVDFERFLQTVHPEDRLAIRTAVNESRDKGGRHVREYRVLLPDGRSRWIHSRGGVDVGADGKATLMRGVSWDVTPRKEAELELGRQRNELAHLSRVTMVSELSGSIAHELNQPLMAILVNAQAALVLLEQGRADPKELRAIFEDIVEDDKRAGQVIQGLHLLLKKGAIRRELLDVNEVVRDALALLRSDLLDAGVSVRAELAPDLPARLADRVQLQQVLLNLIANACDALAGRDAAHREIVLTTAMADDGSVRVCVADNGSGISEENVERMFQPFFTTKSQGLGMGLAVGRSIIAAFGGHLSARRNPGAGMTFCFTLPASGSEAG